MKPYIQPHTADTGPILLKAGEPFPIDPQTALLWIKTLSDYLYSHNVIVLDGKPCEPVNDE